MENKWWLTDTVQNKCMIFDNSIVENYWFAHPNAWSNNRTVPNGNIRPKLKVTNKIKSKIHKSIKKYRSLLQSDEYWPMDEHKRLQWCYTLAMNCLWYFRPHFCTNRENVDLHKWPNRPFLFATTNWSLAGQITSQCQPIWSILRAPIQWNLDHDWRHCCRHSKANHVNEKRLQFVKTNPMNKCKRRNWWMLINMSLAFPRNG